MRSLLQFVLVRFAASLLSLAARLGHEGIGGSGARDLFGVAAGRALREARERADEQAACKNSSTEPARKSAPGPAVEPPPGYRVMEARAHLPSSFGSAVLLVDEAQQLFVPVFVGSSEALAFQHRVRGTRFRRPLTHDLFDALLEHIGARVRCAHIEELRDNVFFATVVVVLADGRTLELDARASDAIVLALGSGAPVFVAQQVLDDAGRPVEGLDDEESRESVL